MRQIGALTSMFLVSRLNRFFDGEEGPPHEAHIPTESAQAEGDARLSRTDEDQRRPECPQAPARKGAQASHRLTGEAAGVGGRTFPRSERLERADEIQAVFQRGKRVERPSVLILWRGARGPRKAGFAVSRQVQGTVRRNRARRRVREAYRLSRQMLPEGVRLVVVARPRAGVGPFSEILRDIREALATIAKECRRAAEA